MTQDDVFFYLIDSGIKIKKDFLCTNFKLSQIAFEYDVPKKTVFLIENDKISTHKHSNIILNIVKKNTQEKINIISIRILDNQLNATYLQLFLALEWIYKFGKSGIINLSLGTYYERHANEIRRFTDELIQKNIYIVCAASQKKSWPFLLNNAIKVTDQQLYNNNKQNINFIKSIDYVVNLNNYGYHFIHDSKPSYAVPFVSSKAIDIMMKNKIQNINELKNELNKFF